ncbi:MAG: hypothetical protein MHPSP_000404 [Paramarteilia canceri]
MIASNQANESRVFKSDPRHSAMQDDESQEEIDSHSPNCAPSMITDSSSLNKNQFFDPFLKCFFSKHSKQCFDDNAIKIFAEPNGTKIFQGTKEIHQSYDDENEAFSLPVEALETLTHQEMYISSYYVIIYLRGTCMYKNTPHQFNTMLQLFSYKQDKNLYLVNVDNTTLSLISIPYNDATESYDNANLCDFKFFNVSAPEVQDRQMDISHSRSVHSHHNQSVSMMKYSKSGNEAHHNSSNRQTNMSVKILKNPTDKVEQTTINGTNLNSVPSKTHVRSHPFPNTYAAAIKHDDNQDMFSKLEALTETNSDAVDESPQKKDSYRSKFQKNGEKSLRNYRNSSKNFSNDSSQGGYNNKSDQSKVIVSEDTKKTCYVSSLPDKVTESELTTAFSEFGNVKLCLIRQNRASFPKFAFITMETEEEAEKCKAAKIEIRGVALKVDSKKEFSKPDNFRNNRGRAKFNNNSKPANSYAIANNKVTE